METLAQKQAELMAAYEAQQNATVATHEARRLLLSRQAEESAASDAVAVAEAAFKAEIESQPTEI
jgi:hypothetical protein